MRFIKVNIEEHASLYIAFLGLLAATPALSTDMYLAAIPRIAANWGVEQDLINLTLVLWFASFSVAILIFGSLSDKYGRKPTLISGLSIFVLASFLCAIAQNASQLIVFRMLQGIGAAAPSSNVMAIIRDKFEGKERQRAMAHVMTIVAIAPMLAPMIGAILIESAGWRAVFIVQGILVLTSLLLCFSYKETLRTKLSTRLGKLLTRYTIHFKNKNFMFTSLSMGLLGVPFAGFIAFSPIYYISIQGLSEKLFGLLFGINALASMIGAYSSSRVTKYICDNHILSICIGACLLAGGGITILGQAHYLYFLLFSAMFSLFFGISRPISGSLILGLVKTDAGSASSLLIFYQFIIGAGGMAFVTLHWVNPVQIYGLLTCTISLTVFCLWLKVAPSLKPTQ